LGLSEKIKYIVINTGVSEINNSLPLISRLDIDIVENSSRHPTW